jgi:Alpha-mannosidase
MNSGLIEDKIKARVSEIGTKIVQPVMDINRFGGRRDERESTGDDSIYETAPEVAAEEFHIGDVWTSITGYLWLETEAEIPKHTDGKIAVGIFDFSSIHEGYGHGFESMLYVNGKAFHGVDENHSVVNLEAFAGEHVTLLFKIWVGMTGEAPSPKTHIIRHASLGYLDKETEECYLFFKLFCGNVFSLADDDSEKYSMIKKLNEGLDCIHWNSPKGFDGFKKSLVQAAKQLQTDPEAKGFTMHCIGQTHIDLAWLWRTKHTREKLMRSFSTALRLMEEFESYRFYQTTPQFYQWVKEDNPALFEEIRQAVKAGRWEIGGGMWVEADCNIPSGESLVRQIFYAKKFYMQEFGKDTDVVWLPDAFGFSCTLPQILKQSGIKAFMTSKLSWNKGSRFPNDTFMWQGLDGSKILSYFLTTPSGGFPSQPWSTTYNGDIKIDALKGCWKLYQHKEINDQLMMTYGHGDGGGGPTREMAGSLQAISGVNLGFTAKSSSVDEFFDALRSQVAGKQLPIWDGDLYLEYHRGTYTGQAETKRRNRELETKLRNAEALSAFDMTAENKGKAVCFEDCWQILLRNQFHDILPGSAIRAVYEDTKKEYDLLSEKLDKAMGTYINNSESYQIFNTLNWERTVLAELSVDGKGEWISKGKRLESAALGQGKYLVSVPGMKPFAYREVTFEPFGDDFETTKEKTEAKVPATIAFSVDMYDKLALEKLENAPETAGGKTEKKPIVISCDTNARNIETDSLRIEWNKQGKLTGFLDKIHNRELLEPGTESGLCLYEDKPVMFDAWDIDAYYKDKPINSMRLNSAELIENNHLRARLRFCFTHDKSTIQQDMIFYHGSLQVDFETTANWLQKQELLRAEFHSTVKAKAAVFDVQFGNMTRANNENTVFEQARFEVPAHKWIDMSQRDFGLSILNNSKYGHSVLGSVMGISLIKSAVSPDETADRGHHIFTYSLYAHEGDWFAGQTHHAACKLNNPAMIFRKANCVYDRSLVTVDCNSVEIDAIKLSEGESGIIVRLHEFAGGSADVVLSSDFAIEKSCFCDLLENETSEWKKGNSTAFSIEPYEIKTIKLCFREEVSDENNY